MTNPEYTEQEILNKLIDGTAQFTTNSNGTIFIVDTEMTNKIMAVKENIMNKKFNIHEWRDSKTSLNEDGGTYHQTIDIYDSGDKVHVDMKDSEDWSESKEFGTTKEAADYIIQFVSKWE
jgi:hypothetical protein